MSDMAIERLERRRLFSSASAFSILDHQGSDILVRETKKGDANLDGSVNFTDLVAVAATFGQSEGAEWYIGDFDFDGAVGMKDLQAIAYNYGEGSLVSSTQFSPEFQRHWLIAQSFARVKSSSEMLTSGTIVILPGATRNTVIDSRVSHTGVLRVFSSDAELPLAAMKESRLRSIIILDDVDSHVITLASRLPRAEIFLLDGNDKLIANEQPNTIHGGAGNDTIYAGGGDDLVYGDEGIDRLYGEGGNDTLFGGVHKDFLDGGIGKNTLIGGAGSDSFTVRRKDKTDREDRDHMAILD